MSDKADIDSLLPATPLTRRGFIVTSLGAGFALAVAPAGAQEVVKTDTSGLSAAQIKVPVADGDMVAYCAKPTGAAKPPVVLVVSEIFGVHEYIADVCRRLAKLGYMAIAPELFARWGDPRKLANIQDILGQIVAKVPDAQVMSDLDACVAWAGKEGGDVSRLGITGFCWGGRMVWLYAAHQPKLKAGVAWYGRLDGESNERTPKYPIDLAADLKAPVLGLYGARDQGIPVSDVEAMREACVREKNGSQIQLYPEAGHAFHADYRPSYVKAAAEDGWKRLTDSFKKQGV